MFTKINDIEKLPKEILVNDKIYKLTIYVTAWNKLCVAYRDCITRECICSVIVEGRYFKIEDDIDNIGDATTLEEAVNMLYEYVMNNPEIKVEK